MPFYETTFVTRQDLSKQDVNRLIEEFSDIIKSNGGKVVKSEYWGLRNLAYRIKKNRKGHYALLASDAPAAAVKEMERNMRINEEIVRILTVVVESIDTEPSAIMQKGGREEGGYNQDAEAVA